MTTAPAPTNPDLTLLVVHAHPDDEATSTGGTLAKYSAEGVQTVLVTCTNGEMGDGPGGSKPGDANHDKMAVAALRRRELEESSRILRVDHLEMLGYRDSGMEGWASNDDSGTFCNLPVDVAAEPLAELMRLFRPQVVVTYDDFGFYGHPDHIQAHRITVAALEKTQLPSRLYFPAIRRSAFGAFGKRLAEVGIEPPEIDEDSRFGSADEEIAATIDCHRQISQKREALMAHASQRENIPFLKMSLDVFDEFFGTEEYTRWQGPSSHLTPQDDLFSGLRQGRGT
jgi:LmbE family N-acetylglucosaminyl deacetylase